MLSKLKNLKKGHLIVFFAIILFCAFMLQGSYTSLLLCQIGIYGIAVTGLDILYGYSGQISFGHAGFYAIGAYATAILSTRHGVPPLLGIPAGAIMAMLIGMIIAIPASKLVKHFLSLLTIAFGNIVFTFVGVTQWLTGGYIGISNIPDVSIFGITLSTRQQYFVLVAIFLIIVLIFKHNLINSRIGRALIAVKEDSHAANGMGINVRSYKVMAFAISAFLTGLAGGMYSHLVNYISPDTFTSTQSILFMTMLLFGGIATYAGPLIGSLVLIFIQIALQAFSEWQSLVYAIFIIATLFFMPNGVCGIIDILKETIKKKVTRHAQTK